MKNEEIKSGLLRELAGMDKAYVSGNKSWFNYLSDDVVVYSVNNAEPFKGKESYQKHFTKSITSSKRKINVLNRQVQTMENIAIVYQTVQINQEGIVATMKQSQVWAATKGGWKINHMHSALQGTPQAASASVSKASAINIINEKIATIATAVGVAQ